MADDDDTSAGLTSDEHKRPMRRRASRSAGPASDNGPRSMEGPRVVDSGGAPAGTITLEKNRTPTVEAVEVDEAVTKTETVVPPLSAGETASEEWHPVAPKKSRGPLAAAIALGLVIVALLGVGGWLLFERSAANDRDAQRQAFVDTAQQTVLNLTTIKPDTAKEDVEKILAGASGEFKSEFDGREDPFVSIVKEAGVTTVGRIVGTGFEGENGNTAKVLVSARADVSSANGDQNGPRDFRMRVTVTDDNGTLTASKVEFVP
ncbi:Mce-associated membrane protein [Rhodococcus sp. OK519]|uniref:hypothetical protein n=1 Tax=Rhodococcus sp. OK519 TaxID=2135729 RepID=UPI000D4AEFB4|nr:Mce-associated membrane protein [Rhodococcus sp. OK519]